MKDANIPGLYAHSELSNYDEHPAFTASQRVAAFISKKFCEPSTENLLGGRGLVYYGSVGTGKTHLAIGVLKEMIRFGQTGIFYGQQELLTLLRNSYGDEDSASEGEIMAPVLKRDVLVLDDLGAFQLTDWVREKVAYILNERYNNKLVTIITTNYAVDFGLMERTARGRAKEESRDARMMKSETLGDRVGERVFSRLQQMCVPVNIAGVDLRSTVLKARL